MQPKTPAPKVVMPSIDLSQFENYPWPDDIAELKAKVEDKWFKPHGVELPGYVLLALKNASEATSFERIDLIDRAENTAYTAYLAYRAQGKIKLESSKPMPEEVKKLLRDINESKRALRVAATQSSKTASKQNSKPKSIVVKPPSAGKKPVYLDPAKQDTLVKKYPWAQIGSFKQDPAGTNHTVVDIKCIQCGAIRNIHLPELFQVKLCLFCKGKNGKIPKVSGKRQS